MPLTTDLSTSPNNDWPLKQWLNASIATPLVAFLILILCVEYVAKQQTLREAAISAGQLSEAATDVRNHFEYELNATLHLSTGVVSYIQSKQGVLLADELNPWLTNLQERADHIRNIGIAPNNKITYVYPLQGNEAAVGLYYPNAPDQWPAVKRVIESHQPLLAGPVKLKQGGLGLIYRAPVYLADGKYWGLVSTVLDFDELYKILVTRAKDAGINISIKDQSNGDILFGTAPLNSNEQLPLNVPGRSWQLLAQWSLPKEYPYIIVLRIIGWLTAVAISCLLYVYLNSLVKQHLTLNELHASQYRFSQAFNSAPQGIALIAPNGDLLDFNASLCTVLGYDQQTFALKNFFDVTAEHHRDRLKNIIDGINPKPAANHQYECALINSDGKLIHVILSLATTKANPFDSAWIIQIIDISHRVVIEQLLQEEANYNQTILQSVVDGILIVDNEGFIRSANFAAEKIFGANPERLLSKHVNDLLKDQESGNFMRHIAYHDETTDINTYINHEIMGQRLDGTTFPLEIQLSCIYRKQEKLFIAVVRDISERKRLDRLKNEFISTISHELRTPLTSIIGSLGILESGALGAFTEPAQKIIRIANQNGKKLAVLINDLLDMDKLIAGKMEFDFKQQPLYPLVTQAIEQIACYAAQHHVQIELEAENEGLQVNVDANRLQQVLANLLSNASKFSPANSTVSVRIKHNKVRACIEVIDRGIGISADAQQRLFQKFYQVDNSTTRQVGGTGLGLAISKELMQAMHGDIGVFSEIGKGSCFYIELPLTKQLKT